MKTFLMIGWLLFVLPVAGQQEGSDTFGARAVVGRDGGEESVAGGVLAVQELQGGFVTEREVGGDIA